MKFSREYLVDELGLPWEADCVVEDNRIGSGRWTEHRSLIFRNPDGKHYRVTYEVGLTECQDVRPWEYEKEIEADEVVQQEVVQKILVWTKA